MEVKNLPHTLICKAICWNVRSIGNEGKLNEIIQILEDNNYEMDFFTGTWFDSETSNLTKVIKDAGYNLIHTYRENKCGGGCCSYLQR